ncbi:DJ-1/PfpI family protein [Alteribacter keqinensis]|uniref:DJ-1/PfpI family protein n=1 Tax=Alteribacter keqinensis TaxID=2483800 RepID=UPI0024B5DFFE|nr:DJ-1/PfpI family protein [Alteribacter keqinensis]
MFDMVDALDFAGPYEVFNLTTYNEEDVKRLFMSKLLIEEKPFKVTTVSKDGEEVMIHNGLVVKPDCAFNNAPLFDIVVIPGGPFKAITTVNSDEKIIKWIAQQSGQALITSVCTGAFFLAKAGLLDNKNATTNRAALALMERSYPNTRVVQDVKYVDEEDVITAAGISAGINMSLHVVKKYLGDEASNRTARTIEFVPNT